MKLPGAFLPLVTSGLLACGMAAHAANRPGPRPPAIHPGTAQLRAFAETALTHLKGPAQRPFLKLLATLPPKGKVPGVTISSKTTKNMSCSGGVCTPTAAIANLNVSELTRSLADGNLTIATTAVAPDIIVNAAFSWGSANGLTLQAIGNITVNKAVSDAGSGPLNLQYNVTGGGGVLSFGKSGHISFAGLANPLFINGQPYMLVNNIQLMQREIGDNPSGNFALSKNYNAKGDGKYSQPPINVEFQGRFEGLGNKITGLKIQSKESDQPIGFFWQTTTTAYVAHFNLAGAIQAPASNGYIGGVVGQNAGALFQAAFDGTISLIFSQCGLVVVGGITGENDGTISFSHATGSIDANTIGCPEMSVGGLLGEDDGLVDYSWAGMSVFMTNNSSKEEVGGLIGDKVAGTLDESFAVGSVSTDRFTDFAFFGGLVGYLSGLASRSSASGKVSVGNAEGIDETGGLVGMMSAGGSVEAGVAAGSVSGGPNCDCGGAIGDGGQVSDTTSYGSVNGDPGSDVGAFIGFDENEGDLSNDGWCTTSSGITDPSQGAGNIPKDPGITPFTC